MGSSMLDRKTELELMDIAPALTFEQAMEYLGVEEPNADHKQVYTRGKYDLRIKAVKALEQDLSGAKEKLKPALAVLLRFADDWEVLNSEGSGELSVKIVRQSE